MGGRSARALESAYKARIHRLLGTNAKKLVKIFKIDEATGLNLADAIALVEDLVDVQVANAFQRADELRNLISSKSTYQK